MFSWVFGSCKRIWEVVPKGGVMIWFMFDCRVLPKKDRFCSNDSLFMAFERMVF